MKISRRISKSTSPFIRFALTLQSILFSNWKLKLLALLLAFLCFQISRQKQVDVMRINVPLEFIDIPEGLEISNSVPDHVNVLLKGPQDLVQGVTANQLGVRTSLSQEKPGERIIQLKPSDIEKSDKLQIRRIEPDTVELTLEQTKQKFVPVNVRFTGKPPEKYEVTGYKIEPESLEIEGPDSHLAKVSALKTETIDLTGRQESFQVIADVDAHAQGVRLVHFSQVNLKVEIAPKKNVE